MPRKFTLPSEKRLYQCWVDIKSRCYNPKCKKYHLYGGKGIKMCDEWIYSFQAFYSWAMQNGYSDSLTIDRINNDGDYCPENCRYISLREQTRNLSTNHLVEIAGIVKPIVEWAEFFEMDYKIFQQKIYQIEREAAI